jgi:hypothetical protein
MKYIINFINKFIQKDLPKPMGRWSMEDCVIKMNQKIDLSNEDHCGPCGQYILSKKENTTTIEPQTSEENKK